MLSLGDCHWRSNLWPRKLAVCLETILADLQSARQSVYTGLYSYIYRRTWELLPPSARHLLLSLLVADPDGEDVDFIYS
jgi:hypothetical protein